MYGFKRLFNFIIYRQYMFTGRFIDSVASKRSRQLNNCGKKKRCNVNYRKLDHVKIKGFQRYGASNL